MCQGIWPSQDVKRSAYNMQTNNSIAKVLVQQEKLPTSNRETWEQDEE
jgi:hypothetical protein